MQKSDDKVEKLLERAEQLKVNRPKGFIFLVSGGAVVLMLGASVLAFAFHSPELLKAAGTLFKIFMP